MYRPEYVTLGSKIVFREGRTKGETIHMVRIFGIMVETNHELDPSNPSRKFKYRVVFQGNNVTTESYEAALFQDP